MDPVTLPMEVLRHIDVEYQNKRLELPREIHGLIVNTLSSQNRKVIQITSSISNDGRYFVIALCDDGTLWKLFDLYEGEPKWEEFPAPPFKD